MATIKMSWPLPIEQTLCQLLVFAQAGIDIPGLGGFDRTGRTIDTARPSTIDIDDREERHSAVSADRHTEVVVLQFHTGRCDGRARWRRAQF